MHDLWGPIVTHLSERFPALTRESETALRFVAVVDGHRVGFRARLVLAYSAPVVVLTAELGVSDAIEPWLALVANGQLVTGALATDVSVIVLRAVMSDVHELTRRFDLFAREAATLKSNLVVPSRAPDVFAYLCD
jgi:hypothetical protein